MPTNLMLLWHMHQPFYKDLAENRYAMPWVRMHALKDYFGMVEMLEEFPNVHMTFNLVPCLVAQLEDYAQGRAEEEPFRIAFTSVRELSNADRESLLTFAFQVNRENLLNRYPRYRELHEKSKSLGAPVNAASLFTPQDLLDLQVLSQLAWFDEIYLASDPEIKRLVEKGRGFREEDKVALRGKEEETFKVTLEAYRKAAARGQIEISTSPFYHPILPLVCDSRAAAVSHPGIQLPRRTFRHPEDARDQLRAGRELMERVFGVAPKGLWPSEGSISEEALRIAVEVGFQWAASDEGVLARSLDMGFHRQADGTVTGGQELYRPHWLQVGDRDVALFFRDHQLSDLIGFVYSRMDPKAAAYDLHRRIRGAGRSSGDRPAVVSVILDGENAWESYPANGREFLKTFYGLVSTDQEVRALTATEALNVAEPGRLMRLVPGSWINANFDVWIGAEEDNRAWDLLTEARDFFTERSIEPGRNPEQVELARHEVWIAEGSDWCWWYGPEHTSAHDEEFDLLYRQHLSNIYRLLEASPPDELAVPIKRPKSRVVTIQPTGRIEPRLDGKITDYFEWLGAGVYVPDHRSGSMHGSVELIEAVYFGFNDRAIYLRVDLSETFRIQHPEFEVRINLETEQRLSVHVPVAEGKLGAVQVSRNAEARVMEPLTSQVQVAFGRILEAGIEFGLLRLEPKGKVRLHVSLWVHELPVEVIPPEGWLTVELTDDFAAW